MRAELFAAMRSRTRWPAWCCWSTLEYSTLIWSAGGLPPLFKPRLTRADWLGRCLALLPRQDGTRTYRIASSQNSDEVASFSPTEVAIRFSRWTDLVRGDRSGHMSRRADRVSAGAIAWARCEERVDCASRRADAIPYRREARLPCHVGQLYERSIY